MSQEGEWRNGLFSHICGGDGGTCLGAWCCSCFLFGRTSQRLQRFPDMETPGLCDANCWLMCGAGCCHLHCIPAFLKRTDIRTKFGIKGDGCTDCLLSYFCFPCTLAQMETEVKDRAALAQNVAPSGGYVQQEQGMVYGAPQQEPK